MVELREGMKAVGARMVEREGGCWEPELDIEVGGKVMTFRWDGIRGVYRDRDGIGLEVRLLIDLR